jgi:hypothetical protein
MGWRLLRRFLFTFGPPLVLGAVVVWLLKDRVERDKAWIAGGAAAFLFLFLWGALRLRLRRGGQRAVGFLKSAVLALLFFAAIGAAAWFLWLEP